MAVRADQSFTRHAEPFEMHLMADAVAGTGEVYAVLFGNRAYKSVVVGVFKAGLQGVVVDVSNGAFGLYSVHAHCLKFEVCHCSRGVLGQGLVDFNAYLPALFKFAVCEMCFKNFLCKCESHKNNPFYKKTKGFKNPFVLRNHIQGASLLRIEHKHSLLYHIFTYLSNVIFA